MFYIKAYKIRNLPPFYYAISLYTLSLFFKKKIIIKRKEKHMYARIRKNIDICNFFIQKDFLIFVSKVNGYGKEDASDKNI